MLDFCSALLGRGQEPEPYIPPWVRHPGPAEPRRGARLWTAPGAVIPRIHRRDGRGSTVRWHLTAAPARPPVLAWRRGATSGAVPLPGARDLAVDILGLRVAPGAAPGTLERLLVLALDGPDDETRRARDILQGWGRLRATAGDDALGDLLPGGWG